MATLTEVVAAIQDDLVGLSGIVSLPDTPPENLAAVKLPAIVVYPLSGYWGTGTATPPRGVIARRGMHTVNADLHVQRTDLATNVTTLMPYADSVPFRLIQGFREDHFDGTVFALGEPGAIQPIRYELVEMNWGGLLTVGWRFAIDVVVFDQQ